jgi:anti-anti-sigma factor
MIMRSTRADGATITVTSASATLSGSLQLASVPAYEQLLSGVADAIEAAGEAYVLDVRNVEFINSSALTALARLVLRARQRGIALTIRGTAAHRWQPSALATMGRLYDQARIELS